MAAPTVTKHAIQRAIEAAQVKWSCFFGQLCGFAKMDHG